MSRINLTEDQKRAVLARSSSVLVSAAAGSGKTRVLTERLMSYITDENDPKDIDSFLIITYTRAAAAELRGRILDELSRLSALEPENRRLRRQSSLCYRAQIGTIHSFCTSILREFCHEAGLTPDFRVGDEDKCAELREKALEKVLDEAYEHIDSDSNFASLADSVGAGRDDSRLVSAILDLHEKMQSHPYPEKWATLQLSSLDVSGFADASETIWGREIMKSAEKTAAFWLGRLEETWNFLNSSPSENAPIISAYGESLCVTMDAMRFFLRALDSGWDCARNALPIPFPRFKPLKNYAFEDRKAAVSAVRAACKESMKKFDSLFDAPSEKLLSDLASTVPSMRALIKLTLDFDRTYSNEKRRLNILDFSDLEHIAVRLLCDPETGMPTETALLISKRYTEIMVDEYQDVNAVQDLIFRCISKDGNNIFMVGDVKQSIYRFRLADPSIFIEKYFSYKDLSSASEGEPKKILLQNNFRSDVNILSACNHVFSNIMSKSLGEIDYDGSAALFPPENAKPPRGKTCLTILSVPQADDGEDHPDKTLLEARMVAKRIRSLVESGETILENDKERPIEYGDIAVLLRSPNSAGSAFRRAFAEQGVPVLAEQGGGFFTAPEILIVRSLLSVIDNPHRDISLAAVLSSPVFGFSPDELSLIRTFDRENDFYTALLNAAQENKKCAEFLESLSELRAISSDIGVYELLCLIYERFDLPALFAAADGLGLFPPNLSLLLDCAAKFEENGYRGLYSFINYLKRMEDRGEEPAGTAEHTGSAVSVMSIHKSKGLEFPVVFLADTSRKFNTNDTRSRVLIHPELGLGCKITDINRGIEYPTLARRAISSRLSSEMLSEEMRVLYVAMTRAKERLYISCTSKDPPSLISKLSENLTSPLSPEILKEAPSMSYWLISAALIDSGGLIDMNIAVPESEETSKPLDEGHSCTALCIDESKLSEIRKILEYKYPFEKSIHLPTKLTATSLPSEELDNESQPIVREYPKVFRLPDFSVSEKPLSGTERGTATHIVMQFIDFSRTGTLDEVESEIMRIKELGHLTDRQAEAVDRQSVFRFFSSEIGRRIKAADRVYREMRFSLLCPAEKFFPDSKGEQILLQGVVDCCIEESGLLTVIDYKTDFVSEDTLSELAEHYRKQISAYAYAMSKVLGKPVRSCLLCFLRAGLSAEIFPDIY